MKAYVITIRGNTYSETCADRCIESAAKFGVVVEKFDAVPQGDARAAMGAAGLYWSWPSREPDVCPATKLKRHLYPTTNLNARIGCAMSHYNLWVKCIVAEEPILILEHDAVFLRGLPTLPDKFGAVMLNNPNGATPKGNWWMNRMLSRGEGLWPKTVVFEDGRPDGLAGNSAYIISPEAALQCIDLCHMNGLWPNDATLCRQLVPGLMEVYPFAVETRQTKSTSGGY